MTPHDPDAPGEARLLVERHGDVLQLTLSNPPLRNALHPDIYTTGIEALEQAGRIDDLPQVADDAVVRTRDMQAMRGRASFLGERSIGHDDPGASSARLLVHAVHRLLGERGIL